MSECAQRRLAGVVGAGRIAKDLFTSRKKSGQGIGLFHLGTFYELHSIHLRAFPAIDHSRRLSVARSTLNFCQMNARRHRLLLPHGTFALRLALLSSEEDIFPPPPFSSSSPLHD